MEVLRVSQGGQAPQNASGNNELKNTEQVKMLENNEIALSTTNNTGEKKLGKEDVEKAVDKLNKFLQGEKVHAEYEVHEKLNDIMIRIINNDTKEVILEIPPKKILDMVAKTLEMVGILVDKKA
jgi:flagellar protein FlaG